MTPLRFLLGSLLFNLVLVYGGAWLVLGDPLWIVGARWDQFMVYVVFVLIGFFSFVASAME